MTDTLNVPARTFDDPVSLEIPSNSWRERLSLRSHREIVRIVVSIAAWSLGLSLFLLLRESPFSVEEQRDPVSTTPLLGKSYLETEREIDSATSVVRESKSQWSEGRGNFWGERETERERDKVAREFDFE